MFQIEKGGDWLGLSAIIESDLKALRFAGDSLAIPALQMLREATDRRALVEIVERLPAALRARIAVDLARRELLDARRMQWLIETIGADAFLAEAGDRLGRAWLKKYRVTA
jgi:sulfite reductase beta subunit-like hemoprotein